MKEVKGAEDAVTTECGGGREVQVQDDVQVCGLGTVMRKPQGETGLAKMI